MNVIWIVDGFVFSLLSSPHFNWINDLCFFRTCTGDCLFYSLHEACPSANCGSFLWLECFPFIVFPGVCLLFFFFNPTVSFPPEQSSLDHARAMLEPCCWINGHLCTSVANLLFWSCNSRLMWLSGYLHFSSIINFPEDSHILYRTLKCFYLIFHIYLNKSWWEVVAGKFTCAHHCPRISFWIKAILNFKS